ncbi:thymidylate synthase [Mobiluncus porci]|uniref:Thymidylate synthase n=1 Tax=Mobiluncus porci TaxID=2652278 RepID=A0A7K0K3R7_9ACTO|nr:thymidylate synthase [Mobiluncus porci]MST50127.1 thymidylate synthase [Mobiluncus porci]
MNAVDHQYEDLLREILDKGVPKEDRTGTGTRSLFARQLRYDLSAGFPAITTKSLYWHGVVGELLWFLQGGTNVRWLQDNKVHIWDEWADESGDLGPVYGHQWRAWPTKDGAVDQIANLIENIKQDPSSRRLVVSAWNVSDLPQMALAPCHMFFQCWVGDGKLSLQIYQRSCDMFLGVPFNIASYALLTHMLAQQTGLEPGELVWTGGDCHIYSNHVDQVNEQLTRDPYPFPTLALDQADSIEGYTFDMIRLEDYEHHPKISAPVAV